MFDNINDVQQAENEYRPLVMAAYVFELANAFHSFYHAVPVLQTEDAKVREARLQLVAAAGYELYSSDIADSPIARDDFEYDLELSLVWRF